MITIQERTQQGKLKLLLGLHQKSHTHLDQRASMVYQV